MTSLEKRREHLERLPNYALVLFGILIGVEVQIMVIGQPHEVRISLLRFFTVPMVALLSVWLIKEIAKDAYLKKLG